MSSSEGDLLILYAIGGDLENFSQLIRMSDNNNLKNYQDTLGKTPLMHAIENGRRNIIEYLLQNGASIKSIGGDAVHGVVDALYYEDIWNRDHPQDQMNYIRKIGNILDGVFPLRSESTETRGSVNSKMSDLTDINYYEARSRSPSVFSERGGKKKKRKNKTTRRNLKNVSKRRRRRRRIMSKRR